MNEVATIHAGNTMPTTPLTPMAMIDRALASGATADTLEKLMALQERLQASQAKTAFDEAIAVAKSEIPTIIKNKEADFESKRTGANTSYKYETLPALAAAIDPVLHRHGLNYRFSSKVDNGAIHVTCIISHAQGHREETTLQCAPDTTGNKNSVQAIGSATTYLQRYTLKLALGISASDDTDGHLPDPSMSMEITAEQFQELKNLLEESKSDEAAMLAYVNAKTMEGMTLAQYAKAKAPMVQRIARMKNKEAA